MQPLFDKHFSLSCDLFGNEVSGMLHSILWGITEEKEVALQFSHPYLVQRELVGEIDCQLLAIRVKPLKQSFHLSIGSIVKKYFYISTSRPQKGGI